MVVNVEFEVHVDIIGNKFRITPYRRRSIIYYYLLLVPNTNKIFMHTINMTASYWFVDWISE